LLRPKTDAFSLEALEEKKGMQISNYDLKKMIC